MFRLTRIFLIIILNLLFFAVGFAQNQSERTASISGRITVGGRPAARALVVLTEVDPKKTDFIQSPIIQQRYRAMTDADGSYRFTGLPAGEYEVTPLSEAYLPADGARGDVNKQRLKLEPGEARGDLDFAVIRGGVITGRVTDDEGRPQMGRHVTLYKLSDHGQKLPVGKQQATMFVTDDRGVYRIFGLRPGRYLARAGQRDERIFAKYRANDTEPTYHPNAADPDRAKIIEIKEGSEATGVDIKLIGVGKTYEVFGRVVEEETGKPVSRVRVACIVAENQEQYWGKWVMDTVADSQGNFRLAGLTPGKYKIVLSQYYEDHPFYAVGKYFEIENASATGVEVIAKRGGTMNGVVVLQGDKHKSLEPQFFQAYFVLMNTRRESFSGQRRSFRNVRVYSSPMKPDGSFQFKGIPPGNVAFEVGSTSGPFYFLRVERDGVAQPDGINIGEAEAVSGVRLIMGYGDGAIRGEIKVLGGTLPADCALYVNARPADPIAGPLNATRRGMVDLNGEFLIKNLLPGENALQISDSCPPGMASSQTPKLPRPVPENVTVAGGTETRITVTLDFNRRINKTNQ